MVFSSLFFVFFFLEVLTHLVNGGMVEGKGG